MEFKGIIYTAGPYRAPTEWGVTENIRTAERYAIELWKQGWVVICPHKNTACFGGCLPDDTWLMGDLEILKRCDAIFMLPGWENSEGARVEHTVAHDLGLKTFYHHEWEMETAQ